MGGGGTFSIAGVGLWIIKKYSMGMRLKSEGETRER